MPINSVALANTFNEFRTTVNDVITKVNAVSDVSGVVNANTLIGGTVTANNLTSGRVTLATTSGQLTDDSALTYDTSTDILTLAGTTDASSSTTGTLKVAGGLGVAKKLYVGTDLAVTANTTLSGTTDASSSTTGAVIITGGVGIAKKLYVGTDLAVTGNTTITGNLTVNGTTTTVNSTTLTVDDINIELGSVATPTDVTAAGGGITLKGATDKTFNWVSATTAWTSSEHLNLLTGKVFEINGTSVLSSTTLGSGVTGSSLTSVGTIGTGVWQGTLIGATYGGTGVNNGSNTLTLAGNVTHAGAFAQTFTATANTTVTLPTTGTLATLTGSETLTNKSINLTNNTLTATSAQILAAVSDETGTGSLVFATSPTLVTPALGAATATSLVSSGTAASSFTVTSGSAVPLTITNVGTGNSFVVEDSANPDASPFVINAGGQVIMGYTAQISGAQYNPSLEVFGADSSESGIGQFQYGANTSAARYQFNKTRGATANAQTVVVSGDELGTIQFAGSDGTGYIRGAFIRAEVDGTPGTNDMPGRMVFSTTADGASTPTERMRIDSTGSVGIGQGAGGAGIALDITKAQTGAVSGYTVNARINPAVDVTSNSTGFQTYAINGVGTSTTNFFHYTANQGTFAGTAPTNQYGFNAASTLTGATNNYGFYSAIAAAANRFNFYAAGTADNYFAGNVGIGTASPTTKLDVSGTVTATAFAGAGTNITGTATAFTASNVTTNANLTGDVTSVGNATTLTNAPVIAKVLTGYVSGAGTVAATDSILQAIQKLNGNDATNANLTGAVTSVGNATSLGSFTSAQLLAALTDETGTGANVFANTPTLVAPLLGTPTSGNLANCTFPTLNQNTTGNASTATTLQTARAINGVSFDGSAAITVTAAAGTLSGATLTSGVTASSLTSVGTISSGVWNGSSISTTYTDAKVTSIVAGTNISLSGATGAVTVNVSGTVAAATTAGTVTTAAQPSITSVGTLTGLTVSATITGSVSGNSGTVGGFTPSASSGVANRVVVADANGYIFNTYFNSSDNSVSSGVTAVMVKTGTNYLYSGTAAAIATFLSGQSMNISGSATSATSAGTVTTAAQPSITSVGTLTSVTTSGPIYRYAAGAGYLNGLYGSVESSSTSGAIYSIGGSYVPGTTTLGNMYGVGYTYSGTCAGTTGAPSGTWGFYAASAGVSRVYLDSDNGRGWFSGDLYVNAGSLVLSAGNYNSYAPTLTGTGASGTWSISVTGNSGTVGGLTPSSSAGVASRVVAADASGYIFNTYFNSTDDTTTATLTYIMGKFGDNYLRSASAAKVATFISGQTMNISGTATGLSAILSVASGGTGTSSPAIVAGTGISVSGSFPNQTISASSTLPSVTGNAGKFLYTDGSTTSWQTATLPGTAPTSVAAAASSLTAIDVSYTQGSYGTENRIYYSTTSPVTTSSSYVVGSTSSGSITGLTQNTTYYVAVGTYNIIGITLSSQVTASTPPSGTTIYTAGQSFNVTSGTATFLAGSGVTSITVECAGGGGGGGGNWNATGGAGGTGGVAAGIYNLSAGRVFTYYVGGGGSGGGQYAQSGFGGGASAVVLYGGFTPIAVGGGAGGGGDGWTGAGGGYGGAGGTATNQTGPYVGNGANGQTTMSAGGGGGSTVAGVNASNSSANGVGRVGGKGGNLGGSGGGGTSGYGEGGSYSTNYYWAGGGGGGGYFGGAGGWGSAAGDGGGGGSSYLATGISAVAATIAGGTSASATGTGGNGRVKVTFN